jgi:ABC-2 type transport system ATP-binding protein
MKLQINSLSKTYANGVHALKDVSLTLNNGMFGLLGPNGAGKSSLMRTIATLQEADKGSIFLDDLDVLEKQNAGKATAWLPAAGVWRVP